MYIFSSHVEIPAGAKLAGYADRIENLTTEAGTLEVHGIGFDGVGCKAQWELCAVDALYPGALAVPPFQGACERVVAASHTHFAPMLDPSKPSLGVYSPDTVSAFTKAISAADRLPVSPDSCLLLRSDVDLPVYRRFDFPRSLHNCILTRRAGFFPNEAHPIDKGLYILIFMRGEKALAAIAYHACHPTTRYHGQVASADYVMAIRQGVARRFGLSHCMFLLGCAGDVRPNLATKRIPWLPRGRLNWRFKKLPSPFDQDDVDNAYRDAVRDARPVKEFSMTESSVLVETHKVEIEGLGMVDVPKLELGGHLSFSLVPFEVSHRYHLDAIERDGHPRNFIVSCAGDTYGYLPHPNQIRFGGYEVDGSRSFMALTSRIQANRLLG
jgi:hypothetical protein